MVFKCLTTVNLGVASDLLSLTLCVLLSYYGKTLLLRTSVDQKNQYVIGEVHYNKQGRKNASVSNGTNS